MNDYDNHISFETELSDVMKNHPDRMHVSCYNYTPEQIQLMLEALKTNTTVVKFNIEDKGVGDDDVEKFCDILKENDTMRELGFGYNFISNVGSQHFAKLLSSNTTLENLSLEFNNIGEEGAQAFLSAFQTNTTLFRLGLSGNNIHQEGGDGAIKSNTKKAINNCLKRNQNMWLMQFWSPWKHESFLGETFECNDMVIASLICNTEVTTPLPMLVWKYIFSFWRRNQFMFGLRFVMF